MNSKKIKQIKRKLKNSKRHLNVHFRKSTSPDGSFEIFDGHHGEILAAFSNTNGDGPGDLVDALSDAAERLGYGFFQLDNQYCLIKDHKKMFYFDVHDGLPMIIAYPPTMSPALRNQTIEQLYESSWL